MQAEFIPPDDRSDHLEITDVQIQQRRAARRSIFINGAFAFGVCEETYVRFSLFTGRELTAGEIEEILREDEQYAARLVAMHYLSYRMRTISELRSKLRDKEFSDEAIEATLAFLAEYRMTDDGEFSRAFVNDRLLKRRVGRRRLQMELHRKGVDREEAAEVVRNMIDEEAEFDNALEAARGKARRTRTDDPKKWERSMASFLSGRGFGWDVVRRVIDQVKSEVFGNHG